MGYSSFDPASRNLPAWNAGQKIGPKRALFDIAVDSKLRGCDLVRLRIGDLVSGNDVRCRALVIQQAKAPSEGGLKGSLSGRRPKRP